MICGVRSALSQLLCTFLYTSEQLAANSMQLVGRPKLAGPLPKALPRTAVEALLDTLARDRDSKRQTGWAERDLAIVLTALLAWPPRGRAPPSGHRRYPHYRRRRGGYPCQGQRRQGTQRAHRGRIAFRHRGVPRQPRCPPPPRSKGQRGRSGVRLITMARKVTAVCRPQRRTHYPWNIAIAH